MTIAITQMQHIPGIIVSSRRSISSYQHLQALPARFLEWDSLRQQFTSEVQARYFGRGLEDDCRFHRGDLHHCHTQCFDFQGDQGCAHGEAGSRLIRRAGWPETVAEHVIRHGAAGFPCGFDDCS